MKQIETKTARFNVMKWALAIILLVVGVVGQTVYPSIPPLVQMIAWVVLLAVATLSVSQTEQGRSFMSFAREARTELRKVTWPTRQETVQTTFIVIGMVLLIGIILFAIDSILLWAISLITI